jgi:tungstate transport system substrate-binding protein
MREMGLNDNKASLGADMTFAAGAQSRESAATADSPLRLAVSLRPDDSVDALTGALEGCLLRLNESTPVAVDAMAFEAEADAPVVEKFVSEMRRSCPGKAIKLGENGDVDIVFAHAPELEEAFVASGYGVNRTPIMYNYFILLAPDEDPAGVRGAGTAPEAYRRIAAAGAALVSRGDESGTHQKEKEIWAEAAGSVPKAAWLMETGQGMGPSLQIADEKRAYILTDRGTYLAYKEKMSLVPVMESDETLLNPYSLIAVNPEKYPSVNYNLAMELIRWMSGEEGKAAIEGFRAGGESMFFAGEMEKRD